MKVTLDLDELLSEQKITQIEYDKFSAFAAKSTGSLAFNILIGFGVIAVSAAALALVPKPTTAIIIGLFILFSGLALFYSGSEQWKVLTNICVLVGALLTGGGIGVAGDGSLISMLAITILFALASIFARSGLLAVLATLMLSTCVGTGTGYFHASYFLFVEQPSITVILFSLLGILIYQLSKMLPLQYEGISIASSRTSVFLVNFGFWVGSLWGDNSLSNKLIVSDTVFSILWAAALLVTAIWAWNRNRRWVLNTVATFGGIHFYTQWFERLGANPYTVLVAGIIALIFALGLKTLNDVMKKNA